MVSPLYSFCNQTVTVYHRANADDIERTVYPEAFLDFKKVRNIDKTGSADSMSFLLVIPGSGHPVEVGDKVILGEGPEVTTDAQWREFIPAKVKDLVVVKYVDAKYHQGLIVHTEAGG